MAGQTSPDGGMITGINVTPMVDIMLVLLVIFMVTAKLGDDHGIPVDLPTAASAGAVAPEVTVAVPREGPLRVDGREVPEADLVGVLTAARAREPRLQVLIAADGAVPHRRVMAVMDQLREAGVTQMAFAAEPGGK